MYCQDKLIQFQKKHDGSISLCSLSDGRIQFPSGFYLFIYLLAELGLCCCTWAFSSCGERGLLFLAVCGLLIAVASLVAEHGL